MLLDPISVADFRARYQDRRWIRSRAPGRDFSSLFHWRDLEPYLFATRPWERPPGAQTQMRLIERGAPCAPPQCIEDVQGGMSRGATLNLNHVQTHWLPLKRLCDGLVRELRVPVSANIYCTPTHAAGFATHFDDQDVLILQVAGRKRWRVHAATTPLPFPRSHQELTDQIASAPSAEQPTQLELQPGDVLYLPRGTPHDASTTDEASLHITLAITWSTWVDLLGAALAQWALDSAELRQTPAEPAPASLEPLLRAIPRRYVHRARMRSSERVGGAEPAVVGPPLSLDSIDDTTAVELRAGIELEHRVARGRCLLWVGARRYSLPERVSPYLEHIRTHRRFVVSQLPDDLPGDSKVAFARWLLARGLVTLPA